MRSIVGRAAATQLVVLASIGFGLPATTAIASGTGVPATVTMGSSFRTWQIDPGGAPTLRVDQLAFPWVASVGLSDGLDIVLSSAYARSSSRQEEGVSVDLDGTSAIAGQLFWRSSGRHLMVQLGAAPSGGRQGLTGQEYALVETLHQPLFDYSIQHYGQGTLWNAAATLLAEPSDQLRLSFGLGGVKREDYPLVQTDGSYLPASEFSLTAGISQSVRLEEERSRTLSLDVTARTLGQDRIQGQVVYREGLQGDIRACAAWSGPASAMSVELRGIIGSRSEAFLAAFPNEAPLTLRAVRVITAYFTYTSVGRGRVSWGGIAHVITSLGEQRPIQTGYTTGLGPTAAIRVARAWRVLAQGTVEVGHLNAWQVSLPASARGATASVALEFSGR